MSTSMIEMLYDRLLNDRVTQCIETNSYEQSVLECKTSLKLIFKQYCDIDYDIESPVSISTLIETIKQVSKQIKEKIVLFNHDRSKSITIGRKNLSKLSDKGIIIRQTENIDDVNDLDICSLPETPYCSIDDIQNIDKLSKNDLITMSNTKVGKTKSDLIRNILTQFII